MQSLRSGYLLQNRYKIAKILGKGGFDNGVHYTNLTISFPV